MFRSRVIPVALGGLALALGAAASSHASQPPAATAGCTPDGQLRYLCGPVNAEDVLRLGNTRWLITSGMDGPLTGGAPARGRLYLVDHEAKSFTAWFPGSAPVFRKDEAMFKDCPGPVDTASFSPHGLSLKEQSAGRYRLYATSHGAREAIEVFEVDASGAQPSIAWVGCVVLPDKVLANSVAILPDGGFVTTQFMDRSLPESEAFAQIMGGAANGMLYEWHPGGRVEPIAGTAMSGPNGIVVSADGRTLYVAAFGTGEFVRFERSADGVRRQAVKLDITPDNLRWTPDGRILAAGGTRGAPGRAGWAVVEVDPQTLAARTVASGARITGMQGVTVGELMGNEIWVGTFNGDRIGYVPVQ